MTVDTTVQRYIFLGGFFQFPMLVLWGLRGVLFSSWMVGSESSIGETLQVAGLLLMGICMIRIYLLKQKKGARKLVTSDVFTVTRHPMYHGMFVADLAHFFRADLTDPLFWVTWVAFVFLILGAGWFQEKETLARWGEQAVAYYRRTPRFVFEWLWFRRT